MVRDAYLQDLRQGRAIPAGPLLAIELQSNDAPPPIQHFPVAALGSSQGLNK